MNNSFILTVPYLATASINHCFIRGQVRYGYKKEVRDWKDGLRLLVQNAVQHQEISPPIQIQYCIFYPRRTRKGDPPNFSKIIQDAVCEGLGFDDSMQNCTIGPMLGFKTRDKNGEIIIEVREVNLMDTVWSEFRQYLEVQSDLHYRLG